MSWGVEVAGHLPPEAQLAQLGALVEAGEGGVHQEEGDAVGGPPLAPRPRHQDTDVRKPPVHTWEVTPRKKPHKIPQNSHLDGV